MGEISVPRSISGAKVYAADLVVMRAAGVMAASIFFGDVKGIYKFSKMVYFAW